MEDAAVKKWSVTYTKHIKQKRKVYQDGLLELHTATAKVKLYDDCEKLLECRILKNEEEVSSGETLTFNGYLVDVGDPEGDHKSVSQLNFQGREKKVGEKPNMVQGHKFRNNSISSDRKIKVEKKRAQLHSLSPSRRIIRDFKKSELHKYGTPRSSLDTTTTTTTSVTEWQVMYTTQVTQKAKKYHDGFLRLSSCGSMGRQVGLCDESRKVLCSRFLKKDEVIKSGESIAFDGYLVEVGDHQPLVDLNVQGKNCKAGTEAEKMNGRRNYPEDFEMSGQPKYKESQISSDTTESSTTEWEVLYTSHVTQKAKKYHDGFLQHATRGSWERQIMLYDATRKLLDSRFLKKDEVLRSGDSIAFGAHFLVDIGEIKVKQELPGKVDQGNNINLENTWIIHRQQDFVKPMKPVVKGNPQSTTCSVEAADSHLSITKAAEIKLNAVAPTKKHVRDAHQILSILQKPMALESNVGGCTDKSTTRPISFSEGHQVSDASPSDHPENSEPPRASVSCHSTENVDIRERPNLLSSRGISSYTGSEFSKEAEPGNSNKSYADNVEADAKRHTEPCAATGTTSSVCTSHGPDDDEMKTSEFSGDAMEKDDCPSFDLGF